jgi:apolipoprotein N-acyltransferase
MPSSPSPLRALALAGVAVALSGALLHAGTGLHPLWWATWLAPLPLAWAAPRLGAWAAAGAAAAAWTAGALNAWGYLRSLHLPLPVALAATLLPALVFAAAVAMLRAFARRGAAFRAGLAVPVAWVAYELVQSRLGSQGTFGSLAYSQADALPVLQLASVAGLSGVTFAVLFLPCAAALVLSPSLPWPPRRRLAGVALAAAAAVLGFGLWRLRPGPPARAAVAVGLAASDLRGNVLPEPADRDGRLLREYLGVAQGLARAGARVIVLPEKLAERPGPSPALDAAYQALADETGTTVVAGVILGDGPSTLNAARAWRAHAAPAVYRKRHLLPGWESRFTAGATRLALKDPAGTWGVAVCKDLDFPATVRDHRDDGLDLLLVPAWDFDQDGWLHARMAVVRGVEGGFGVVRAAKQGLLTVSDARGRILAERSSGAAAPFSTLQAEVPLRGERTLYAAVGDAPGWLDVAGLLLLVGSLALRPRRGREPAPPSRAP